MNRTFLHEQQNVRNAYCNPQSKPYVLEACYEILNIFKPNTFLELGFGNGDWSLLYSDVFSDDPNSPNYRFYGIDNFELCNIEGSHEWYTWARNIEELRRRIETWKYMTGVKSNFYPTHGDILNNLKEILDTFNTRYDCIRLDCLCRDSIEIYNVLSTVLEYTEEKFILLLDDCGLTQCPQRLSAAIKLVKEKKLIPIWISDDEIGFVGPNFDTEVFIESFKQNHKGKYYLVEDRNFEFIEGFSFPIINTRQGYGY